LDDNDAVPYKDAYDSLDCEKVFSLLGEKVMPDRWNKCIELYKSRNVAGEFVTYDSIGHEHQENVKVDILTFFKMVLN
jgi:hypothetical protein